MHKSIIPDDLIPVLVSLRMRTIDARTIVPLPYQKKCVEIIKKASVSRERILLAIAMGFGKTTIIYLALNELLAEKRIKHALVVSSKKPSELESERELKDTPIASFSLVKFRDTIEQLPSDFFDIVFLDDCQNLSKKDWEIAGRLESAIVGLTSSHPLLISSRMLSFFNLRKPTYSYGISSVRLKELADVFPGANYHSAELLDRGKWKFIRPRDIKGNRIQEVETFASEELVRRNPKRVLNGGDILLQNIFNFSRMAIITEKDLPAIASRNLFVIRSRSINPKFLFDYLQSKTIRIAFRKQLEDLAHGFIKHVNLADIREMFIPLPFSEEHLESFVKIEQPEKLREHDLEKARNELRQLRRAYQEFLRSGEKSHES